MVRTYTKMIELNGERYVMPSCYEELKTKHYCRIHSEWDLDKPEEQRDYFKLFCILSDSDFKSFVPTNENEVTIWNAIAFVINQPFKFTEEIPKALEVGEKNLSIPRKIEMQSIGQNIILKQQINKVKSFEACIGIATAIYLQPEWSGTKFDFDKAMELKEIIDEMPAYLIYPIGFFLLKGAMSYGKPSQNGTSHTTSSRILKTLNRLLGWHKSINLGRSMTFQSLVNMLNGFLMLTLMRFLQRPALQP